MATSHANIDCTTNINKNLFNLYIFSNKIDKKNKSNCMDFNSIINVLNLIYKGTGGETKMQLTEKTNLEELINSMPKSMYTRSGVFIRKNSGYEFMEKYKKTFRKNHVLSFIPETENSLNLLNELFNTKFRKKWINNEKFFTSTTNVPPRCKLYIKDQSFFVGCWKNAFNHENTKIDNFYVGNETIKIPMMKDFEKCSYFSHQNKKLDCLFASIPYDNDYCMLIIMPNSPCNKNQLLYIIENGNLTNHITNFYYKNGKDRKYSGIRMPKFEFKTEWNFNSNMIIPNNNDDDDYKNICPYLQTILYSKINMENLINSKRKMSVHLVSSSNIINDEYGTSIKSETEALCFDSGRESLPVLNFKNSFIFLIMNKDKIACKIGIFVG